MKRKLIWITIIVFVSVLVLFSGFLWFATGQLLSPSFRGVTKDLSVKVVSYKQTQDLVELYTGPKTVWFPEKGEHSAIWDVDHADYEKRVADFLYSLP
jgi:fermentation-respiration switch protein FrsA (DUF1100 family)